MKWFKRKREAGAAATVQLREEQRQAFGLLSGCVPGQDREEGLYRAVRETVPVVDAAIWKLVRLSGGVDVRCRDKGAEEELRSFLQTVNVGRGQQGINAFLDSYLDSMLVSGRAVAEIVPTADGRDIYGLFCGDVKDVEIREGDNPMDFALCAWQEGKLQPLPRQELLLFTPFQPESGHPYGVSLLRGMPFLAEILLKIYRSIGQNWERCGNVRYAVVYKPQDDELDRSMAQQRSEMIAEEWSRAMQQSSTGTVRDFVAVGDVEIRAIGADNQILDSSVPVRQILEQLVAKTGIPPFMLGLSWSSTERMSAQQADMLTSEITAIRRSVTPMLQRICRLWLRMHGYSCGAEILWDEINLQDQVEEARAELYRQQARGLCLENEKTEGGD